MSRDLDPQLLQTAKRFARQLHGEDKSRFIDALRVYLGLALMGRGVQFVSDPALFDRLLEGGALPFASTALAHLVGVLHLGGGLLLAAGLLTRIAAAVQIPAVAGAPATHAREGRP